VHLGLTGGGPAVGQFADLLTQMRSLVDQQAAGDRRLQPHQAAQHERGGDQEEGAEGGVDGDLGQVAGEAEQPSEPLILVGQVLAPEPEGQPARPGHHPRDGDAEARRTDDEGDRDVQQIPPGLRRTKPPQLPPEALPPDRIHRPPQWVTGIGQQVAMELGEAAGDDQARREDEQPEHDRDGAGADAEHRHADDEPEQGNEETADDAGEIPSGLADRPGQPGAAVDRRRLGGVTHVESILGVGAEPAVLSRLEGVTCFDHTLSLPSADPPGPTGRPVDRGWGNPDHRRRECARSRALTPRFGLQGATSGTFATPTRRMPTAACTGARIVQK
jgi:hypothetical protein